MERRRARSPQEELTVSLDDIDDAELEILGLDEAPTDPAAPCAQDAPDGPHQEN